MADSVERIAQAGFHAIVQCCLMHPRPTDEVKLPVTPALYMMEASFHKVRTDCRSKDESLQHVASACLWQPTLAPTVA